MKKWFSAILALTLVFTLTQGACAAPLTPATAVTISADSRFTTESRSVNAELAAGFQALLEGTANVKKSDDMSELARFSLEYGDKADASPRVVYKAMDGSLYLEASPGKRLIPIDADSFYTLADSVSRSFYKYRPVPKASLNGTDMAVTQTSYAFRKLDSKLYKTQVIVSAPYKIEAKAGQLPVPVFDTTPKSVAVSVTPAASGSKAVWQGTTAGLSGFKPEASGSYIVRFTAQYESEYFSGAVTYAYSFGHDANIDFSIEGAGTNPGEVVILKAKNIPEGAKITVSTDIQFTPSFFRLENGDMAALLPVSYYTAPGEHYVELSSSGVTKRFKITAANKQFVVQNLTVPPATAEETINSQKANDEYEKNIAPIRPVSDSTQYWSGRFIWPLAEHKRITTEFGTIRYTNGSKTASRHGALDIAAPAGTPIYASGAGRVLYSGFLQLTGYTIVIEHGLGLKTWHYHMNGVNVKAGDMVKQGDKIGVVGSTGFSTGAHLHFGMSVNNVFINPNTAIYTDLLAGMDK